MIRLLFWLLFGHALADYPLQGDFLSRAKRRDGVPGFPWWLALSSHALIHGGFTALITGSVLLGVAETINHFVIDYAKCQNKIGIVTDQALHVFCKVLYVVIIFLGRAR